MQSIIPLNKVQEVYVTKKDFSAGKTVILTTGVAVGSVLLSILALFMAFAAAGGPG
jgi:hypothetical protein